MMRFFLLLLLMLVFQTGKLEAQQKQVHKLSAELSEATSDSTKLRLYCKLSGQYTSIDQRKALVYARKALDLAVASDIAAGRAQALNALGAAYVAIPDIKKAIAAHTEALQISTRANDVVGILQAHINLGNAYAKAAENKRAIEHYLSASDFAQKIKAQPQLSRIYALAGSVYESEARYKDALTYYIKAAKTKEELGEKQEWAESLVHIGLLHTQMNQPEKALPYMLQALQLNDTPDADTFKIDVLRKIAATHKAMQNSEAAVKYALQSYKIAESIKANAEVIASAKLLQAIYAGMNDFRNAYRYQSIVAEQEGLLKEEREKAVLAAMVPAYDAEKKDLEALWQQAENEKQVLEFKKNLLIYTLGTLAILSAVALLFMYFVYKRRLGTLNTELQEAQQQLQARTYKVQMQREELEQKSIAYQQQNEQLERHNNFKNKIFSIISHDLRSPFASVKGVLNLVQNKPMSEAGIKYLFKLLSKDLDVTLNMLNNLLVWSKAQLEGSDITYTPIDMQLLVEENIGLTCLQANNKNIHITNMVSAGTFVHADKERVNFVLRNLIMNALKFTFEGGGIAITAKEQDDAVTIAVRDNGRGISVENLDKLFTEERFTTIGTSSEKGTGLGLMLCREFIESMNGSIGVDSQEGKGSTFYFTLQKATVQVSESEDVQELQLAQSLK